MTEDEARTKWCPMFRASISVGPTDASEIVTNQDHNADHRLGRCLASGCMAWRHEFPSGETITLQSDSIPPGPGWGVAASGPDGTTVWQQLSGYCGLAGKP
jgi:hypothetical protein